MPDYFGNLRISQESARCVTLADGTTKAIPVVSNPIDSGVANVVVTLAGENPRKLTKKLKRELWDRDKNRPWFSRTVG